MRQLSKQFVPVTRTLDDYKLIRSVGAGTAEVVSDDRDELVELRYELQQELRRVSQHPAGGRWVVPVLSFQYLPGERLETSRKAYRYWLERGIERINKLLVA